MFSSTHRLIAHHVFEAVLKEFNVKLDYMYIRYGSIAPDIHIRMLVMSHRKEGSFNYLLRLIKKLINKQIPSSKNGMRRYSYRLGVVTHFIADYFCRAHNERRYKNPMRHYFYERRLALYLRERNLRSKNITWDNWTKKGTFEQFIEDNLANYHNEPKSLAKDSNYALDVAVKTVLNIVKASVSKGDIK